MSLPADFFIHQLWTSFRFEILVVASVGYRRGSYCCVDTRHTVFPLIIKKKKWAALPSHLKVHRRELFFKNLDEFTLSAASQKILVFTTGHHQVCRFYLTSFYYSHCLLTSATFLTTCNELLQYFSKFSFIIPCAEEKSSRVYENCRSPAEASVESGSD